MTTTIPIQRAYLNNTGELVADINRWHAFTEPELFAIAGWRDLVAGEFGGQDDEDEQRLRTEIRAELAARTTQPTEAPDGP